MSFSSSSIEGRKNEVIRAIETPHIIMIAGIGRSNSATRDEKMVTDLAMKLHIPIAVALL